MFWESTFFAFGIIWFKTNIMGIIKYDNLKGPIALQYFKFGQSATSIAFMLHADWFVVDAISMLHFKIGQSANEFLSSILGIWLFGIIWLITIQSMCIVAKYVLGKYVDLLLGI